MRKALLMLALVLVAMTPMWSQSLAQQLIEISNDLNAISDEFDTEFQTLETQLQSFRSESTQILAEHSRRLDDSESDLDSFEGSLTDLRSSHMEYRTYVQTALQSQATEIRSLQREIWVYRVGGGALAIAVMLLAVRASSAPP